MPYGFTLETSGEREVGGGYREAPTIQRDLQVTYIWREFYHLIMMGIGVCLIGFFSARLDSLLEGPFDLAHLWFPVSYFLLGLLSVYYGVAGAINRTALTFTEQGLTITHGPIPWARNRTIQRKELKSILCEEREVEHRSRVREHSYALRAVLQTGAELPLLGEIPKPDQALYIVQAMEEALGFETLNELDE